MAKVKSYAHFRPHARVQFTGELVDPKTGEVYTPPSMTKQEFVAECDINNIIKQFSVTGQITHINARAQQGAYEDLPDPVDFQQSLHIIKDAEAAFMALPSKVRERFGHEPGRFLEFCSDPANLEEMRSLGIAKALVKPEIAAKAENPAAEAKKE